MMTGHEQNHQWQQKTTYDKLTVAEEVMNLIAAVALACHYYCHQQSADGVEHVVAVLALDVFGLDPECSGEDIMMN
jgi:hypothetical protein